MLRILVIFSFLYFTLVSFIQTKRTTFFPKNMNITHIFTTGKNFALFFAVYLIKICFCKHKPANGFLSFLFIHFAVLWTTEIMFSLKRFSLLWITFFSESKALFLCIYLIFPNCQLITKNCQNIVPSLKVLISCQPLSHNFKSNCVILSCQVM